MSKVPRGRQLLPGTAIRIASDPQDIVAPPGNVHLVVLYGKEDEDPCQGDGHRPARTQHVGISIFLESAFEKKEKRQKKKELDEID